MTGITNEVAAKVLDTVDAGLCSGLGIPIPGQMCVEAAVCYALELPHGDDPACVSRALRSFKIGLNDARWSSNKARSRGLRRLALIQLGSAGHLDDNEFARHVVDLAICKVVPAALRSAASIQKDPWHKASLLQHADICERDGTRKAAQDAKYAVDTAAYAAGTASYAAGTAAAYADAASYAAGTAAAYAYAAVYAAGSAAANAAAYAVDAAAYAAVYAAGTAAAHAAAYAVDADATYACDKFLEDFAEEVVQLLIKMNVPGVQWLTLAPIDVVA
jgi:hypothetical protein